MREKNSERPDTRDNRSKNSTKTGKKKKNTKNQEFAVITYSFLALFICLMGYFSYFQFFKSEEFINNPYNTRQETFAQKIVRGQILTIVLVVHRAELYVQTDVLVFTVKKWRINTMAEQEVKLMVSH